MKSIVRRERDFKTLPNNQSISLMEHINLIKLSLTAAVTLMLTSYASDSCYGGSVSAADQQKRRQALASSDHLIVPGERIGPIRLGMGMDEVAATLGRPNLASNPSIDHSVMWRYGSLDMEIFFSGGAAPSVTGICTRLFSLKTRTFGEMTMEGNDPIETVYRTTSGIALGASSFEVKRSYSSYGYEDHEGIMMTYKQLGISFMVGRDHRIWQIQVNPRQ